MSVADVRAAFVSEPPGTGHWASWEGAAIKYHLFFKTSLSAGIGSVLGGCILLCLLLTSPASNRADGVYVGVHQQQ